ncbi:MAG: hypothetical protein ABI658_10475 [Acidimicrobiales bacterium]
MEQPGRASIAAMITIAGGAGLITIHHFGGSPGDPEGWFESAGLGAPFIGAGLLGLLGVRLSCPCYCAAAGLALWPMCLISVVGFPLLIPATVLMVVGVRNDLPSRELAIAAMTALVLAATTWYVVLHQDPASWTTKTGSGSSSNVITTFEATLSVSVVTMVLIVCSLLPPRRQVSTAG